MIEGRRSATAERVAMRRAAHQLYDRPLVFEDPLALRILSDEAAAEVRDTSRPEITNAWAVGLRAFVAARSRFAEEELARAFAAGMRQYVVLGAGLDTFACRNPFAGLAVFEVDFPDTQAWKRARLRHAAIPIPDSLRFAPVDFERHSLADGLDEAGFHRDQPAFFSWLGVVPYLTREAAFATLRYIAGLPRGSGVVFDYPIPPESMGDRERAVFMEMAARTARAGEPFRLSFEPPRLESELRALGFCSIEDLDYAAIRARWFGADAEQLRPHGRAGHLLCAWL
ncbi:MAG TPA: class I SAM-dependent methyltransferase [Acidobacteriaceae bacterium]|nr:class I SAM-dependent methyltransferase [Acidobacteriaceae bacterium]